MKGGRNLKLLVEFEGEIGAFRTHVLLRSLQREE